MYQTQQWTPPQGTGLNRYAKGAETETHLTLTLDPESLTNTPTPFTAERMTHIENGIADAYAIENVYPLDDLRENALGQTTRTWSGMTTIGNGVYASVANGDIYKQTGGVGNFVALGQTSRNWLGMTTLGNDIYACVYDGDIYKQTGGVGNFIALGQTSRYWRGMTTLGTDVYASVANGDIYKQTGGVGNFVALGQTSRYWHGMTTLGNDVYACVTGGDIYKQTGGTGDFVALGQTSRSWTEMTTLGSDVYACVTGGDIYKQTGGVGNFIALGQTTRPWRGMTTHGNDIYASVYDGDIYKLSLSNTIRASADFTLSAYPDGSRKRIANTHASNTITCTLPSGQTMNGAGTISIPAGRIIDIELIGTTWKDNLTGNADTATKLATPRLIGSANFDGSANITQQEMNVCTQTYLQSMYYGGDYLSVIAGPWGALNNNHASEGYAYRVRLVVKTVEIGSGYGQGMYIQELKQGSSEWTDRARL